MGIDRRGRAAGKSEVSLSSLRRIEADTTRASRVRRGDAPATDGRESRPPRRDLRAPDGPSFSSADSGAGKARGPMRALGCLRRRARSKLGAETRRDVGSRRIEAIMSTHLAAKKSRRRRVCCACRAFVRGDAAPALFLRASAAQLRSRGRSAVRVDLRQVASHALIKKKINSTQQSVRVGFVGRPPTNRRPRAGGFEPSVARARPASGAARR